MKPPVDLRLERDEVKHMLQEMAKKMVAGCHDDFSRGFYEGVYDRMLAAIDDLPVVVVL